MIWLSLYITGLVVLSKCVPQLDLGSQDALPLNHHTPQTNKILFVSLWEASGKEMALRHAHKFTTMVVCHYDVSVAFGKLQVKGLQPIDKQFLTRIRKNHPSLNILFRMYMLDGGQQLFEFLGSDSTRFQEITGQMIRLVRKYRVDGVYLDSAYNLPLLSTAPVAAHYRVAAALTNRLANRLHSIMHPHETLAIQISTCYLPFADLPALKNINASAFALTALETSQPIEELQSAVEAVKMVKNMLPDRDLWIVVGLFGRRNGVGVRSGQGKDYYFNRNPEVEYSIEQGMCSFKDNRLGVLDIPCRPYYEAVWKEAQKNGFKVGLFEASDALPQHFELDLNCTFNKKDQICLFDLQ